MVQTQLELNEEENRTVELIQAHFQLRNKEKAIKKILQLVGKDLKIIGKAIEIKINA